MYANLKFYTVTELDAKLIIPVLQNSKCSKWQLSDFQKAC